MRVGDSVVNTKGKASGKLRGIAGRYGLGLLRVAEVLTDSPLTVHRHGKDKETVPVAQCDTHVPEWWPAETDEVVKKALEGKG